MDNEEIVKEIIDYLFDKYNLTWDQAKDVVFNLNKTFYYESINKLCPTCAEYTNIKKHVCSHCGLKFKEL